jgi:hypothetical protein
MFAYDHNVIHILEAYYYNHIMHRQAYNISLTKSYDNSMLVVLGK